ncbi:MAG: cupin domain-containing protein [Opitutaceae bacterium]|nr:cupin domain-containing protein [Opitutaceae bacterium]
MNPDSQPGPAARIAAHLGMAPIPHEGPLFVRTYESDDAFGALPARYAGSRPGCTAIHAIITAENFSALHRLATDELWFFHAGGPLELLLLHPGGRSEIVIIGPDVLGGQRPQACVPRGVWMGARPLARERGAFALISNTLAPGFDYADYEPGHRAELVAAYPDRAEMITALTRDDSIRRPTTGPASPAAAELVALTRHQGHLGPIVSARQSIVHVRLAPRTASPAGFLRTIHETIIVTAGRGVLELGESTRPLAIGDVCALPPGVPHRFRAAPAAALEYYAVCAPAFRPEDYVVLAAAERLPAP